MKKTLVLMTITLLVSGSTATKTRVLTSVEEGMGKGGRQISSDQLEVKDHAFSIEQEVLHGGKQEGSKILAIHGKDGPTIILSSTRGTNSLRIEGFGSRMSWDSLAKRVANPMLISLGSRNGLGWLEGFNEVTIRCGCEWTSHPVTTDGQIYTLHDKVGSAPTLRVEVEVADSAPYEIHIRGLVRGSIFKKADLQTLTGLRYALGSNSFSLHDVSASHTDYPHDYQIVYHNNFGTPILEEGARFLASMPSISPLNDYVKSGLRIWQTYRGPTRDLDEIVFDIQLLIGENHQTLAVMVNKAGDKGTSIQLGTHQLPVLTLWKNTDTIKQGHVAGIKPGTSYAYPVTIEREQKRVKQLQPGVSAQFGPTYTLLYDSTRVTAAEQRIAQIQGNNKIAENETLIARE